MAWNGRFWHADVAVLQDLHKKLIVRPKSLVINLKHAAAAAPLYAPVLDHATFHNLTKLHIQGNRNMVVQDVAPGTILPFKLESFYVSAYRDTQTNEELIRAAFASSAESLIEVGVGYANENHPDAVVLRDGLIRAKRVERVAFSCELLPPVLDVLPTLPALKTLEINGYTKIDELERFSAAQSTPPSLEELAVRPFHDDVWHPAARRSNNEDRYGINVDPDKRMLRELARNIEIGGNLGALSKLKLLSDKELDFGTDDGKYLLDVCQREKIKVAVRIGSSYDNMVL
ncbi:hypothetical protein RQP46_000146 [Phenoliferia psychrophenolica]